ncbi:MAG TPA: phosphatidylinositol mannoside acyltransferase [Actinomycetota bacterium]|nr:phosphatidylinositol mannoside acyltransferase [Actinomycetota bacterium]
MYYGYVAGSAAARAVPERWAYRLAHVLGTIAARRSRKAGAVARNLATITGESPTSPRVRALVVETYRSYARYWLETFRLVREGRDFFLERFECLGEDNLDAVLARGKGAVVVVGHLGNWDAAGAWVAASGRRLVSVAEVLRPRRMFEFFAAHRARLGMVIVPAERGASRRLVEEVEAGSVVAILGDRDLKGRGPEVTFFGRRATLPAGPASIALRTGVPLLVAGVYGVVRPDGTRGWEAHIGPPIELPENRDGAVAELTQRVAHELERLVARRPQEWHVLAPVWPDDADAAGDGA